MNYQPKPEQVLGMRFLRQHDVSFLMMGLGLGKTVTALSVLNEALQLEESRSALLIAPKNVMTLQWPNEVAQWDHTRWMKLVNLRTKEGWKSLEAGNPGQITLINPERLPTLCEWMMRQKELPWDHLIIDESTMFKNPTGVRFKKLMTHAARFRYRWAMTGTPAPNSLLALYGQVKLLDLGQRLGTSYDRFKRQYFYPTDYMEYNWEPFEGAEQKIYAAIQDISLSLRTQDYTKVPDPVITDEEVDMPKEAWAIYHELEKELIAMLDKDGDEVIAVNAAVLVGKMMQITGGSVYVGDLSNPNARRRAHHIHDAKLKRLEQLCKHYARAGVPVLIACSYHHEQERILKTIKGAAVFRDRPEFLDAWNARKIPAMVANPRSIGHGLNLQKGSNVIVWYSLGHSLEIYDQFNARLVRSGQTESVNIHRIVCPDSIDEAIAETLRQRAGSQQELLSTLRNIKTIKQNIK